MQTHEWEALLHNTTPGPWRVDPTHPGTVEVADGTLWVAEIYGDGLGLEGADLDRAQADAAGIATWPDAVAEVIRLRKAIEDLLGTLSKAKIDIARGDYEHGQHTAFLFAASQLTRILEGEEA